MAVKRRLFGYTALSGLFLASLGFSGAARPTSSVVGSTDNGRLDLVFDNDTLAVDLWQRDSRGLRFSIDALDRIDRFLRDRRTGDQTRMNLTVLLRARALSELLDNAPLRVLSGYRSASTNAALSGSVPDSFHRRGMALDIRVDQVPFSRLAAAAPLSGNGGTGIYPAAGFVHIDCGPTRRWTTDRAPDRPIRLRSREER